MSIVFAYIIVVIIWSTTPLAVSWSAEGVDLFFALSARMLIGLVLSYVWMRARGEKLSWELNALKLYTVSLLGTVGAMYSVYWSSQYIASGLISVLFGLAPILAGGYAAALLAEKFMTPRRLLGAMCALIGLAMIFQNELSLQGDSWKGVLGILLSVNLYALSSVLIKRMGCAYSSLVVNTGSLGASVLVLVPMWFLMGADLPSNPAVRSVSAIIYLGVFGSFVGFVSYYYILKRLPTASAMLVTLMTPVIALYLGAALNEEVLDRDAIMGSICVLLGLLVYLWPAIFNLLKRASFRSRNVFDR